MDTDFGSLFLEADNLRHNGKVKIAIEKYRAIAQTAQSQNRLNLAARALHLGGIAATYAVNNRVSTYYRDALYFFQQAAGYYQQEHMNVELGSLYRDVAILSDQTGEYPSADEYYQKSSDCLEVEFSTSEIAATAAKYAYHFFLINQEAPMIEKIQLAEKYFNKSPSPYFHVLFLFDQAKISYATGDNRDALQQAQDSLSWHKADHGQSQYLLRTAQLHALLSLIFAAQNKEKQVKEHWQEYQKISTGFDPEVNQAWEKELDLLTKRAQQSSPPQ